MPKVPAPTHDAIIGPSSKLLRNLRIKFIAINMATTTLLLATIFAVILYADYTSRINTIESGLEGVITEVTAPQIPQLSATQRLSTGGNAPVATSGSTSGTYSLSSGSSGRLGSHHRLVEERRQLRRADVRLQRQRQRHLHHGRKLHERQDSRVGHPRGERAGARKQGRERVPVPTTTFTTPSARPPPTPATT